MVAARVLNAPRASAQVELVRDGATTARVRAPTTAWLAVDQTRVAIAKGRAYSWTACGLQVRRAIANHSSAVAVLQKKYLLLARRFFRATRLIVRILYAPRLQNTSHIQDWQRIQRDFYVGSNSARAPSHLLLQVRALEVECRQANPR